MQPVDRNARTNLASTIAPTGRTRFNSATGHEFGRAERDGSRNDGTQAVSGRIRHRELLFIELENAMKARDRERANA